MQGCLKRDRPCFSHAALRQRAPTAESHELIQTNSRLSIRHVQSFFLAHPPQDNDNITIMSSQAQQTLPTGSGAVSSAMQPNNAAMDLKKPGGQTAEKVKVHLHHTPIYGRRLSADVCDSLVAYARKKNRPATSVCSSRPRAIHRPPVGIWWDGIGVV